MIKDALSSFNMDSFSPCHPVLPLEVASALCTFRGKFTAKANDMGRAGAPLVVATGSKDFWQALKKALGEPFVNVFKAPLIQTAMDQAWLFGVTASHRHYGAELNMMGSLAVANSRETASTSIPTKCFSLCL